MNIGWLFIVGAIYAALLVAAAAAARRATHDTEDYMLAGSRLGVFLGALTFGATLFSTFTLMGMPDFFRRHGVGAWIFLGVADAAVAFVVLWYAVHIRRAARRYGFAGVAGLVAAAYRNRFAGLLCFVGVFIFLIPYVAVQIRGISLLLTAAYPDTLPLWGWSLAIVAALIAYSEVGGLKAIIYSDAMQAIVLLGATWFIAWSCVRGFGGFTALVAEVRAVEPALLSTPGPRGLFGFQFMVASLFAILALPITQPQLAARVVIMKDLAASRRMAIALGVFAMLVIGPTIAIGFFGVVAYPGAETPDFLARVLLLDRHPLLGAIVAVGLIAAAMSTADSQLFALGGELRSLLNREDARALRWTKLSIALFGVAAYAFAVVSTDQLVLLARVSFAGTAMLAPLILCAVILREPRGALLPSATAFSLLMFLSSVLGITPDTLGGMRLDLVLFILVAGCGVMSALRANA